jgi:pimeloyl-ACP methyl ester carboxylesterase
VDVDVAQARRFKYIAPMTSSPTSVFFAAPDGLKLHVRTRGPQLDILPPVICLPGLTRTAEDFDTLAQALAERGRRVLALDSRGRGLSEYDRSADNYSLQVELADLMAMLTVLEARPAVFVGSSRGGLLTMLLAAQQPTAILGAILNDIGPVIEPKGVMRIKGYVGKLPTPRNFEEGGEILRRLFGHQFPAVDVAGWELAARRAWREEKSRLILTYDTKLAKTLKGFEADSPIPPLWAQFDALSPVPVMVVRGANSDLFSSETVAAMKARRSSMEFIEVADQGHTPLLAEPDIVQQLVSFVESCAHTRQ